MYTFCNYFPLTNRFFNMMKKRIKRKFTRIEKLKRFKYKFRFIKDLDCLYINKKSFKRRKSVKLRLLRKKLYIYIFI